MSEVNILKREKQLSKERKIIEILEKLEQLKPFSNMYLDSVQKKERYSLKVELEELSRS